MKKNKNIIWLFDEIYRQEYLIIFTPTYKKYCEIVKKEIQFCPDQVENDETISGEFTGLSNKHSSLGVIWASDKNVNLIHELIHACAWTLRNREIYLTQDTEETYAYYYTYLFRTIHEAIKLSKKGGKNV